MCDTFAWGVASALAISWYWGKRNPHLILLEGMRRGGGDYEEEDYEEEDYEEEDYVERKEGLKGGNSKGRWRKVKNLGEGSRAGCGHGTVQLNEKRMRKTEKNQENEKRCL
jgi:hypothetical protein